MSNVVKLPRLNIPNERLSNILTARESFVDEARRLYGTLEPLEREFSSFQQKLKCHVGPDGSSKYADRVRDSDFIFFANFRQPSKKCFMQPAQNYIDLRFWMQVARACRLGDLLGEYGLKSLFSKIQNELPPLTLENIKAQICEWNEMKERLLRYGMAHTFRQWHSPIVTCRHIPFDRPMEQWWFIDEYRLDPFLHQVHQIELYFRVFDNDSPSFHNIPTGFHSDPLDRKLRPIVFGRNALRGGESVETKYMKLVFFPKGTQAVSVFKRKDLFLKIRKFLMPYRQLTNCLEDPIL